MGEGLGGTIGGLLGTLVVIKIADLAVTKASDLMGGVSNKNEGLLRNDIP